MSTATKVPGVHDAFSANELKFLDSAGLTITDSGVSYRHAGVVVGTVIPERARAHHRDLVRSSVVDILIVAMADNFGIDLDRDYRAEYYAAVEAEQEAAARAA